MPRTSKRAKAISCLSAMWDDRIKRRAIREMDDDEDSIEDLKDLATAMFLSDLRKRRHFQRPTRHRRSPSADRFATDLNNQPVVVDASDASGLQSEAPWLSDDEFLHKCRVSRRSFQFTLSRIGDNPVFEAKKKILLNAKKMCSKECPRLAFESASAPNILMLFSFSLSSHLSK